METWSDVLFGLGRFSPWVLLLGGWIWLLALAWRRSRLWAVAAVLFPPSLFLLTYRQFEACRWPLALFLLGLVLIRPMGLADIQGRNSHGLRAVLENQAEMIRAQEQHRRPTKTE